MRVGQNAVKTPGRTRDNDCVTKGVKFRSSLFKGLQVQGGALVALRTAPSPDGSLRAPSGTSASQKARFGAKPP